MLELPTNDPTNSIKLADWLELYAMISGDSDSSRGDLEGALRVASFTEISDNEAIERKILEVFYELEERASSAGIGYPFQLDGGLLRLKSSWKDYPVYSFCLSLSYFGLTKTQNGPSLFEKISCYAAKKYLNGNAIGFGFPRTELPPGFSEAINELCNLIGEGRGFFEQPMLDKKDDKLDLVAWVDFIDKLPSKLIMFGQCAAGNNWEEKLAELQPDAFWNQWMREGPVSPLVRSFFIPHRIERDKWNFTGRNAGIVFDRCRIAYWAHQIDQDFSQYTKWVSDLLSSIET